MVVVELDRVRVEPASRTLVEGESFAATATPLGPDGEVLSGRSIVWSTSDPSVATLSGTAGSQVTVTAQSVGTARIEATSEGRRGAVTVDVLEGPSLVLSTSRVDLVGRQGQLAPSVEVGIANGGNGSISGLQSSVEYRPGPVGWLTVGLNGTTVPTTATLVASGVGLPVGKAEAVVRITSPDAGGLSASVNVVFEVQPPPPTIDLASNTVGLGASFGNPVPATASVPVANGGGGTLTGLAAQVEYPAGGRQGWLTATLSATTAPTTLGVSAL
ncbi:MAG: Ig-like domain-containing protein, partial [Gemmatimonadetes bacterium]|nr:Ig-like domain-containing protein [Gemmatimonadota bacterium]